MLYGPHIVEQSNQELFEILSSKVLNERASVDFETYKDFIDELVEDRRSHGYFNQHEDLEQIKADLEQRWHEIEIELHDIHRFSGYMGA